ncbi:MAG: hypothetical protein QFX35_04865 [Candidatus Verstraetearchaeota archaeon]|nr:hypothetical protein [Candidatus Verstraetearchaeota archaeon]
MVRLLDIEVSRASLALRVISGVTLAALTFLLLYMVPSNLPSLIWEMGREQPSVPGEVLSSLVDPMLPILGLALVPAVFLNALLKKTAAQGPIMIVIGLLSVSYIYLAFHGGVISLDIPPSILAGYPPSGGSLHLRIDFFLLMVLFMIPHFLSLVRGLLFIIDRHKRAIFD